MSLDQQLFEDMKCSMKAKDKIRVETIRSLRGQLKNASISKGSDLSEDEVIQEISRAAKKRKESIEQFKAVGREDRASIEQQELDIIHEYLPDQMDEYQIAELVGNVFEEINPTSEKDIGKIMSAIMPKVKGRADGKLVQQIVRNKLSSLTN